jgi:ATP-binding cassette subfamily F protein 3
MLNFSEISLQRGGRTLFDAVTLTVHAGQKVGISGPNGSGKSSLFALIRGELQPDRGELSRPPRLSIAHVAQETPALEVPALEYVVEGDEELRDSEAELAEAERIGDGPAQATLHARLEALDGYTARSRAARLMRGLGFGSGHEPMPVRSLSGGWRERLNLARALMRRSELLLLDEPTNHLDLDAVIWLQDWLRGYAGTLLLISHDRDFLDEVVDHIILLDGNTMRLYSGNYSRFELRRTTELAGQQAAYEKQQRKIAHVQGFVNRFRAKATKARQAQSRLKALAQMERIAPAHVDSPFGFEFPPAGRVPNPLLRLDDASAAYGKAPVLGGVSLSLGPGDRLALLGANGAGKSTLIKLLAGELEPRPGGREASQGLHIGYFAQHQLEQLDADASPLDHLRRLDPDGREQQLRDFLGGLGFQGDAVLQPVAPLSGGEKSRLVLALLVFQRPNLLLLDEPTNHLDLDMRHALNLALQDFEGAMVLVSHDRHLLRTTADRFLLVAEGRVENFPGDLEDYRRWLIEQRSSPGERSDSCGSPHSAAARRGRRREEAELRRRLQPLRRQVERLESSVSRLTAAKADVDTELAGTGIYRVEAKERLRALLQERRRLEKALRGAEEAWLLACEELESEEQAG